MKVTISDKKCIFTTDLAIIHCLSVSCTANLGHRRHWTCHEFNVLRRFSWRASFTSWRGPLHLSRGLLGIQGSEWVCFLARKFTYLPITVPAAGVQSWPSQMWRKRKILLHPSIVSNYLFFYIRSPEECSALCHKDSSLAFQYDSGVAVTFIYTVGRPLSHNVLFCYLSKVPVTNWAAH